MDATPSFDDIVVGTGPAGSLLANRLSADPQRRVLVLEAGPATPPRDCQVPANWGATFDTDIDWKLHTVAQAGAMGRRIAWPRGRVVGGSGSINAMIYIRGLPSDFERWQAAGARGWGWRDVLPVFLGLEDNRRWRDSPLHGTGGELWVDDPPHIDDGERAWVTAGVQAGHARNEDFNGPSQAGVGFYQLHIREGERFGAWRAFLQPALARGNLSLRTGALVTRVLVEGGRAVGIEWLERGQPRRAWAERGVTLCAGAIASPQLLMLSGIGDADALRAAGVDPVHHLPGVGANLQDHLNVTVVYRARQSLGLASMSPSRLQAATMQWDTARTGPLSSNWVSAGGHLCSGPEVNEPDIQLYGGLTANRDHGRFLAGHPGVSMFGTLQRPESVGTIRLRDADPLSPALIDPRYLTDPQGRDLATLVRGVRLNRDIAAQPALADMIEGEVPPSAGRESDAEIAAFVRAHCTSLYHPCGTCRIGVDEAAVVDPWLQVRGLDGLRVADASVFPCVPSGNTQAPTYMVAQRAATFMGA